MFLQVSILYRSWVPCCEHLLAINVDSLPEANREVAQKSSGSRNRDTDKESEEKFAVLSKQIEDSFLAAT